MISQTKLPPSQWSQYIAAYTTGIAAIGLYFGTFVPFVEWLDQARAIYWMMATTVLFLIRLVVATLRQEKHFLRTHIPLAALALAWGLLPFMACGGSNLLGNDLINASCKKLPPNIEIAIRKFGNKVTVVDSQKIRDVVSRVRNGAPVEVDIRHPEEMERLLSHLRGQRQEPGINELLQGVKTEEASMVSGFIRLISSYTGLPLPPSKTSEEFHKRIEVRLRNTLNGMILLTGQDALDAVRADIDGDIDYTPEIENLLVDAASKYLEFSVLDQYGFIRGVRKEDAAVVDPEFLSFLLGIPTDWRDLVKLVGFAQQEGLFDEMECGGIGIPLLGVQSSKFVVPRVVWPNNESRTIVAMGGVYQMTPRDHLNGAWWLEHAIWQMLARVSDRSRDSLPLLLEQYSRCGRP